MKSSQRRKKARGDTRAGKNRIKKEGKRHGQNVSKPKREYLVMQLKHGIFESALFSLKLKCSSCISCISWERAKRAERQRERIGALRLRLTLFQYAFCFCPDAVLRRAYSTTCCSATRAHCVDIMPGDFCWLALSFSLLLLVLARRPIRSV